MTETEIYDGLKDLAGGSVFPYVAPVGTSPPWIVFSIVSDVKTDVLDGQGPTVTAVQVDVYAATVDEARILSNQSEQELSVFNLTDISRTAGYEHETGLYRVMMEVRIWH